MIATSRLSRSVTLSNPEATAALAGRIAALARVGDVIALTGGLGAGKTAFARAFIAARAGQPVEVPSPTFTLVQTYDLASGSVWHLDLYRIDSPEEAEELGLDEAFASGIVLIEWPERLGERLPADALSVLLESGEQPDARRAHIKAAGDWAARLGGADTDD